MAEPADPLWCADADHAEVHYSSAMLKSRLILFGALVALVASACVPPEEELEPLARDYPETTTMGAIQERGVLRVGLPGVTELDTFAADIALGMAETLGVDLETVRAAPDRVHLLLGDGRIDVAFPLKPLTEQVVRRNAVTDPYLLTSQRMLVPAGIDSPGELEGRPICVTGDPQVTIEVGNAARGSIQDCLEGLRSGDLAGASGLDVELVAILAELRRTPNEASSRTLRNLQISGEAMSTAGLSIFVPTGASDMVVFVERYLTEYKEIGEWTANWNTTFTPYLDAPDSPPSITAEEAATLFPRE